MQVSVETLDGLQRKMMVTIPATEVDSEVGERLVKLSKKVRLAGFRPGKVPMKLVKQNYGASVRSEVIMDLMNKYYFKAIDEQKLKPAGMPSIEEPTGLEQGQEVTFAALFEVFPEIEIKDFSTLSVERLSAEVTDADVKNAIEKVREQQAKWVEITDAVAKGNRVTLTYNATLDGETLEAESKKDATLIVGDNLMVSAFEDALVGQAVAKSFNADVKMPDDYVAEELRGKTVSYDIEISKVEKKELPELDEDFMKAMGVAQSDIAGLEQEVKANLERELKYGARNLLKKRVIDQLVEAHSFDLPAALIDQEAERLKQQSLNYFKSIQPNGNLPDMPAELFKPEAEKQVRVGLLLSEVISKTEVKADDALVDERIADISSMYDNPEEAKTWLKNNKQQLEQIKAQVLEDQVVNLVIESAKMEEKAVSYDELVREAQK